MEDKRSFYGIIPAYIRYAKTICPNAKLLYSELTALCNERGYCWAKNEYFANLYEVSEVSVSIWIKSLERAGFINIEYDKRGFEVIERRIFIEPSIKEIFNGSVKGNLKDNNTVNNTVNKNKNTPRFKVSKPLYRIDSIQYQLSELLYQKIKERNPEQLQPDMQLWCKHIELMITRDKRTPEAIRSLIEWCQSNSFWQNNILSTSKLREKYDQLTLQKQQQPSATNERHPQRGSFDEAKFNRLLHNTPE